MARAVNGAIVFAILAGFAVTGCANMGNPFAARVDADPTVSGAPVGPVDRDAEAPEIFQVTDNALWDGRPSLGGVWVASPDTKDPERVILRNPGNGKFVIGALFRRERINPGPPLQISSDAAAALGMLAGQPAKISVTALRREEAAPDAPPSLLDAATLDAATDVQTGTLDPVATASAGLDKAAAAPVPTVRAPEAKTGAKGGALIQIGIFSVETNAKRAAAALSKAGMPAKIEKGMAQGKDFWRVVAGPSSDKAALMAGVKAQGFTDAFFVSR